jgi:hypothetical protein
LLAVAAERHESARLFRSFRRKKGKKKEACPNDRAINPNSNSKPLIAFVLPDLSFAGAEILGAALVVSLSSGAFERISL